MHTPVRFIGITSKYSQMRKLLLSIAAAASIVPAASAQNAILNNPDNHGYFGARVGWDYSAPTSWHFDNDVSVKMYKPGSGITLGAFYNLPIVANLYFEPGLTFYYDNYSYDDLTIIANPSGDESIHNPKITKTGFRIPLYFGYHFDIWENGGISLFTGPQICLGTSAKIKIDSSLAEKYDITTDAYSDLHGMRRFDIAWTVGAALNFANWQISASADLGLLDMHKADASFRENRLNVALAYTFRSF